jgi:hypothetical protein
LPEPLRFREPRPRQSFGAWGEDPELLEELKEDDGYTAERGYLYARKGVLLKHAAAAYEGKSAATVAGECY